MSDGQKRYEVRVEENAALMLDSHTRFLANVSINAAEKLLDDFDRAFVSLALMPYRCPIYRLHRAHETYRYLIVGRYQIIFTVNEEEGIVSVEYILDSRQDANL